MSWTQERVDRLKYLWGEGLSASAIAADLGDVSRNAVVGKLHRLGCKRGPLAGTQKFRNARHSLKSMDRKAARKKKALVVKPVPAESPSADEVPVPALRPGPETPDAALPDLRTITPSDEPVPFAEAGRNQCRFPLWGPDASTGDVCGKPTVEPTKKNVLSRPYCPEHAALCTRPQGSAPR